jgi:hypothetical protein
MGWWQTKTTKEPVKFKDGEATGQYNPADIRGSYLFGDISRLFEIPLEDLQAAFRLPSGTDPASYGVKSLEAQFAGQPVEIGTQSIRLFVAFYKSLPFDLSADIYLPAEAVEILRQKATLSPERLAYLDGHTLEMGTTLSEEPFNPPIAVATPQPSLATPAAQEHTRPERIITGQTTFQDLLAWGVSQDQIEQLIGETIPDPAMVIRDYYRVKGEEFGTAKVKLQSLVDSGN